MANTQDVCTDMWRRYVAETVGSYVVQTHTGAYVVQSSTVHNVVPMPTGYYIVHVQTVAERSLARDRCGIDPHSPGDVIGT